MQGLKMIDKRQAECEGEQVTLERDEKAIQRWKKWRRSPREIDRVTKHGSPVVRDLLRAERLERFPASAAAFSP
jgi:hypothetical protein